MGRYRERLDIWALDDDSYDMAQTAMLEDGIMFTTPDRRGAKEYRHDDMATGSGHPDGLKAVAEPGTVYNLQGSILSDGLDERVGYGELVITADTYEKGTQLVTTDSRGMRLFHVSGTDGDRYTLLMADPASRAPRQILLDTSSDSAGIYDELAGDRSSRMIAAVDNRACLVARDVIHDTAEQFGIHCSSISRPSFFTANFMGRAFTDDPQEVSFLIRKVEVDGSWYRKILKLIKDPSKERYAIPGASLRTALDIVSVCGGAETGKERSALLEQSISADVYQKGIGIHVVLPSSGAAASSRNDSAGDLVTGADVARGLCPIHIGDDTWLPEIQLYDFDADDVRRSAGFGYRLEGCDDAFLVRVFDKREQAGRYDQQRNKGFLRDLLSDIAPLTDMAAYTLEEMAGSRRAMDRTAAEAEIDAFCKRTKAMPYTMHGAFKERAVASLPEDMGTDAYGVFKACYLAAQGIGLPEDKKNLLFRDILRVKPRPKDPERLAWEEEVWHEHMLDSICRTD